MQRGKNQHIHQLILSTDLRNIPRQITVAKTQLEINNNWRLNKINSTAVSARLNMSAEYDYKVIVKK